MVQDTRAPSAEDDIVFIRRRKIIEALRYEVGIETEALATAEATFDALKKKTEEAEEQTENIQAAVVALESAIDAVIETLTFEQIQIINATTE